MNKKECKEKYDKRLKDIRKELFEMANDCAGDEAGNTAIFLHAASNDVSLAKRCLDGEDIKVPMHLVAQSLGIDLGDVVTGITEVFSDRDLDEN